MVIEDCMRNVCRPMNIKAHTQKESTHTHTHVGGGSTVYVGITLHITLLLLLKKNTFLCAPWTKNRTVYNTEDSYNCLPQL